MGLFNTTSMAKEAAHVAACCNEAKDTGILDLSASCLMKIPHALYIVLKSTPPKEVRLSNNQLNQIPSKFFTEFIMIERLSINNNNLRILPDTLSCTVSLRYVNLSHNQITVFPEALYSLENLEELDVSNNKMQECDVERFSSRPCLSKLVVADNPWNDQVTNAFLCLQNENKLSV